MALIQMKKGKNTEAIETLQKMYQVKGIYLKDLALYEMGRILEAEGKTEEAKEYYMRLAKEFPESPYSKIIQPKIKPEKKKTEQKKETTQEEGK
jgi:TolA-binding protein